MGDREIKQVKLFRKDDQSLYPDKTGSAVQGLVNTSYSNLLGAGVGVFEHCAIEWTVTYDEALFIHDGELQLETKRGTYRALAGDVLWIPKGTWVVYKAEEAVTFFYAVAPVNMSPTTGIAKTHPMAEMIHQKS